MSLQVGERGYPRAVSGMFTRPYLTVSTYNGHSSPLLNSVLNNHIWAYRVKYSVTIRSQDLMLQRYYHIESMKASRGYSVTANPPGHSGCPLDRLTLARTAGIRV